MTLSLIDHVEAGNFLSRSEAQALMEELLSGRVETPDIVRLLTALNRREVQVDELVGFAMIMRKYAAPVFGANQTKPKNLVDTCGTGGKPVSTFNVSTAAAIVAAAAGARVAKHGNRAITSRSGSADVLEALGVRIDLPLEHHGRAICEIGIGFLFAPVAHSSTRHAGPARKEIDKRTVFNLLGPLTNPAEARFQVLGVFSAEMLDPVAGALVELGSERAFIVRGMDGLDEISLSDETWIVEVRNGTIRRYKVSPEDFGVSRAPLDAIRGTTPQGNAAVIRHIFGNPTVNTESGPRRDIVVINAAAALVVSGVASSFREGAELAKTAILSGAAKEKLEALIAFTSK